MKEVIFFYIFFNRKHGLYSLNYGTHVNSVSASLIFILSTDIHSCEVTEFPPQ